MPSFLLTAFASLAISVTIMVMAKLKNPTTRALVYILPIPITIALIGSSTPVTSLNILGVALTMSFLWLVYYLHQRRQIPVLAADVGATIVYVAIAYVMATYVKLSFLITVVLFVIIWGIVVSRTKHIKPEVGKERKKTAPLWVKGIVIFIVAYALLTLKMYLAAFVVTFPYNGVFAVYENRATLHSLAMLVTRNSLGLCGLFVAYFIAQANGYNQAASLVLGWLACLSILFVISKTIKFKN